MNKYCHEIVKHDPQIPAMIAVLDYNDVKDGIKSNFYVDSHWHRSLELTLIEHAEASIHMGEEKINIKDDFICINSGVVHSLTVVEIKENMKCIIILISYDFIKLCYPDFDMIYFDLSLQENHEPLKKIYYRIHDLYVNKDKHAYLSITACILEILQYMLANFKVPMYKVRQISSRNQKQVNDVLSYIHEHYQDDISLQKISDFFHMSNEYFSRQFHHYVGKTFRDYLSSYRMHKAYDDIIHTEMSVQDIARKHGFLNIRSFISYFTKKYKDTPTRYRKKYQKDVIK